MDSELKLISLITQLLSLEDPMDPLDSDSDTDLDTDSGLVNAPLIIIDIISLVRSMNLESQPKPESKLMSLVKQTICLFNSMDLDSQPKPLSDLILLISRKISLVNSNDSDLEFLSLMYQTLQLEPEPELISLILEIIFLFISTIPKLKNLISLSPQVQVIMKDGKFHVDEEVQRRSNNKWECLPLNWDKFSLTREDATHFRCRRCNGEYHKEYEMAPLEIKHPLHPLHSLQLVMLKWSSKTRKCYCCDENIIEVFYYCSPCDYAMNVACVEKQPVLAMDHPKWHEHTLALFPRQAFLTCNLCALADSSSRIYMCPPCDFVVHQRCTSLPRVIKISRHLHRISFTPSFDKRDWSCGVCRRDINNVYGGYSCFKKSCSYAAHSMCATQSNVWDGIELEGEPEEMEEEEEVEPFVRISNGIIQHFSHPQHHLRLDKNTSRDYDDKKQCQICITPIYFGNFYSCMHCDFFLHGTCENISRKMHHPIHPHMLTLVGRNDGVVNIVMNDDLLCSACLWFCTADFFYECGKEGCHFKLHVQCAKMSEPLVHESHMHPLFLTSKPGEQKICSVCKESGHSSTKETFNCITCEFSLCFGCATIPQKVRYKHDKHMLTLSYGEETSIMTYWCEACERKINSMERFYICDKYCCVTLHIKCLIGTDLYMKPGSSWFYFGRQVVVLPNSHHMSRPICSDCEKRCPHKIAVQCSGSIFCSVACLIHFCFTKWGIFNRVANAIA